MASSPKLFLVESVADLKPIQTILGSENTRAIEMNSSSVPSVPIQEAVRDALGVDEFEHILKPDEIQSMSIRIAVQAASHHGHLFDKRMGSAGGGKPINELVGKFVEQAEEFPLHVAHNARKGEYTAYVTREKWGSRFLFVELAEQLMIYKRVANNAIPVENFLKECRNGQLVNDVILAMMIHKAYRRKDRLSIIEKLGIDTKLFDRVEAMLEHRTWDPGGRGQSTEEKRVVFEKLAKEFNVDIGMHDTMLLSEVRQPNRLAIVFRFNSLLTETRELLQRRFRAAHSVEPGADYIEGEILSIQHAGSKDMADFICLDHASIENILVPEPKDWMYAISTDTTPDIIAKVLRYYEEHIVAFPVQIPQRELTTV